MSRPAPAPEPRPVPDAPSAPSAGRSGAPARSWAGFLAALAVAVAPPIALAEPCTASQRIVQGAFAPCDGVLWPDAWSRAAVKCANVELPQARADAARDAKKLQAKVDECEGKLAAERAARRDAENGATGTAPGASRPLLEHPLVALGIGVVVGAAAAIVYDRVAD